MKNLIRACFLSVLAFVAGCGGKEVGGLPAITDLSVVTESSNRLSFVGRRVELENVYVWQVVGDILFIASQDGGKSLPMSDTAELLGQAHPTIKAGQVLSIRGTVEDLNNPPNPAKFWNMIDASERARIMPAVVYVSGESITIR